MTPTQIKTAQAIVNLFETGKVLGDYGQVTLLPEDPGMLTYGRSQTTLGSGNLHVLLQRYADNLGARFREPLAAWLPLIKAKNTKVNTAGKLHNLLRACADDPVMRETQDAFFNDTYWVPAFNTATKLGLTAPLSVAVVYDSRVHGSWKLLSEEVSKTIGTPAAAGEQKWVKAYVQRRRKWLATHKIPILHGTVYRMDAFQRLIDLGLWGLDLPLVVRQSEISLATLNGMPGGCYDGPAPGSRQLSLQQPLLKGLDVRLLQLALSDQGIDIKADGVFGQAGQRGVKEIQQKKKLPVTGVADIALISKLVG